MGGQRKGARGVGESAEGMSSYLVSPTHIVLDDVSRRPVNWTHQKGSIDVLFSAGCQAVALQAPGR